MNDEQGTSKNAITINISLPTNSKLRYFKNALFLPINV